jgi:hypothetical protein
MAEKKYPAFLRGDELSVLNEFDFDTAHSIIAQLGWDAVPKTIREMQDTAISLLVRVRDNENAQVETSGFMVQKSKGCLRLLFIPVESEWIDIAAMEREAKEAQA